MEKPKLNSFIKRLLTTLVLVPVVIGCVLGGYPWIYLLALTAAVLLSWEWADMVPNKRPAVYALTYFFVLVAAMIMDSLWAVGVVMALALAVAFVKSKGEENRKLLMLGVPYITIGIGAIVAIYATYGAQLVLWFMFLVWAADIGGFLFGSTLKGPKLAPKISPKKTWSGFWGGMILAVGVSYAVCFYYNAGPYIHYYAALAAVIAAFAQIGDLVESSIKRHLGIKDSSNLIPGHGGIFDRIDGLIFSAPFAYLLLRHMSFFIE